MKGVNCNVACGVCGISTPPCFSCEFCNNYYHEKCRDQTEPNKCSYCVIETSGVQIKDPLPDQMSIKILEKDHPQAKKRQARLNNPNFRTAMSNVPDIDIESLKMAAKTLGLPKKFNEETLRFQIAGLRWENQHCNRWKCKTPKGKHFQQCSRCKRRFCGIKCHHAFHKNYKCGADDNIDAYFQGCHNEPCSIINRKLSFCQKCWLVQYCSIDCQEANKELHVLRCCKKDGPIDKGPQQLTMVKTSHTNLKK